MMKFSMLVRRKICVKTALSAFQKEAVLSVLVRRVLPAFCVK